MYKHFVIGTAGHIDHGKTTLTKALTGIDTDRLKEEKERNISIELGFAPFILPNGDQVSIVDVPGHEKFIRQMVSGVAGIDLFLLIIAADEGIMPQTIEHFQILNLLNVKNGIIVITKKDIVENDFMQLVKDDIENMIKNTNLKDIPIIQVSSVTNEGIPELKKVIQDKLSNITEKPTLERFRMPIDRVFTLKGIGTVITGTANSGKIGIGQELSIMPSDKQVKIRNLHVHSKNVTEAFAGQRIAINITGIDINEINRGDSIVSNGHWIKSSRIDVGLNLLQGIKPIKHNSLIKLNIGTKEVNGTILLFDRKEAKEKETIYCQIKLEEPIISSPKERFIIRRPSPAQTIGGGIIIEPNATKHKYNKKTVENLERKNKGSVKDLIIDLLQNYPKPLLNFQKLSNEIKLPEKNLTETLDILIINGTVIKLNDKTNENIYLLSNRLENIESAIINYLSKYHEKFPLKLGIPKTEFVNKFLNNVTTRHVQVFLDYLIMKNLIKPDKEYIRLVTFNPTVPKELTQKINDIEKILIKEKFSPDNWHNIFNKVGFKEEEQADIYNYLINERKIVKLTDNIVLHINSFREIINIITGFLQEEDKITIQQAKELLQVSRKYLVPIMELLDSQKITVLREGNNFRQLRK